MSQQEYDSKIKDLNRKLLDQNRNYARMTNSYGNSNQNDIFRITEQPNSWERHKCNQQVTCHACGGKMWPEEATKKVNGNLSWNMCCNHAKVFFPPEKPPPPSIQQLLTGTDPTSKVTLRMLNNYRKMSMHKNDGDRLTIHWHLHH